MPNDALAKIRRKAKQIQAKTGRKYQSALKEAGRMYREGKIGGVKKKRSSSSSHKHATGSKSRSHSRHSRRLGAARPENLKGTLAAARHALHSELGWNMAAQATARTKKEKRGLAPKIAELKKQLRALK